MCRNGLSVERKFDKYSFWFLVIFCFSLFNQNQTNYVLSLDTTHLNENILGECFFPLNKPVIPRHSQLSQKTITWTSISQKFKVLVNNLQLCISYKEATAQKIRMKTVSLKKNRKRGEIAGVKLQDSGGGLKRAQVTLLLAWCLLLANNISD